jgi:hypothetical protein
LKPRSRSRAVDSGIGSTRSARSTAGSAHGMLRISVAKGAAQPAWPWNLNSPIGPGQGQA